MNVIDMPKAAPKEGSPEALKKLIDDYKARMPFVLEYAEVSSEIAFKKYKMLVVNGFTEAQAIELLKGSV